MRGRLEFALLLGVLLLGLTAAGFDVALAHQNRALRRIIVGLQAGEEMSPGSAISAIVGQDLRRSSKAVVTFGTRPTLLFVFSPFCHFCDLNWPNWRTLIASANADGIRVVGIDLTGKATEDYLRRRGAPGLEVVTGLTADEMTAYKFLATPQTVLVARGGTVQSIYTGPMDQQQLRALTAALRHR